MYNLTVSPLLLYSLLANRPPIYPTGKPSLLHNLLENQIMLGVCLNIFWIFCQQYLQDSFDTNILGSQVNFNDHLLQLKISGSKLSYPDFQAQRDCCAQYSWHFLKTFIYPMAHTNLFEPTNINRAVLIPTFEVSI